MTLADWLTSCTVQWQDKSLQNLKYFFGPLGYLAGGNRGLPLNDRYAMIRCQLVYQHIHVTARAVDADQSAAQDFNLAGQRSWTALGGGAETLLYDGLGRRVQKAISGGDRRLPTFYDVVGLRYRK